MSKCRNPGTLLCAALVAALPVRLSAQSIAGTVREDDALAAPLTGAFVSLVDASDRQVDAAFSAAGGAFRLRASSAGTYRLRVQRIGYANWESEPYQLSPGATESVDIRIPLDPVALAELDVTVVRGCVRDPSQAGALADVWQEARKALETAVWAEGRDELRFSLARYRRMLEPGNLAERERENRERTNVRLPPFESLPASRLAEEGFATFHGDTTSYYLPDATALLSQEFRNTHCFGLVRETHDGERRLGVTFEPREGRPVPEIEGAMWLSEETAELRRLEFRYVNVPMLRGVERRHLAGEVRFARLPDGPFYVSEWWVRVPVTGRTLLQIPGSGPVGDPRRTTLAGYMETGGTVTGAFVNGRSVFAREGVRVTGVVRDSATGEPVPGVRVSLRDWERAARFVVEPDPASLYLTAVTDSAGRFEIAGVEDGTYAARLDDPDRRARGLRAIERLVRVDEEGVELELRLPPIAAPGRVEQPVVAPREETAPDTTGVLEAAVETLRAGIDRSEAPLAAGDVVGTVVSAETGAPVPGARIRDFAGTAQAVSGENGAFRLRRLPAGARALEIEHVAYGTSEAEVEVRYAEATVVELRLVPRAIEVEPLEVEIEGFRDLRLESKGFYERREMGEKLGLGSFWDAEEIRRRNPQRISQLVADHQGVRLDCGGSVLARQCVVRMIRSPTCPNGADVYVDGVRVIAGDGTERSLLSLDEVVMPSEVGGLEIYTGAATLPAELSGSSGQCGAIVIWTG